MTSNLYNDRKQQRKADKAHAESVSPTAIVLRDNEGNPVLLDYGQDAGVGSSDLPELTRTRFSAGVKPGQWDAFMDFLRDQTDHYSRWLLSFEKRPRREFNEALAEWVKEWDAVDLGPVFADFVEKQRK